MDTIIPLKSLCSFADYFNYSIDYVLGLTNIRKNPNLIKGLDLIKLGNNIKELRIKNELSQENVANMIGVTQACITRYEKGLICISTSNLYKLSKEFKISLSELCGKVKKQCQFNIPITNSRLRDRKNQLCQKANLKQIRIHDFRHSCASLLINNGANITMVAKYLGHTKIDETLNTYSHMFKNKLNDIVNTINKLT